MKSEHEVFAEVIDVLERLKIPYMIGGSVAAIAYGEPRLTLDMDVVIQLSFQQAKLFANSFGAEYYVHLESIQEALQAGGHFNIIQSEAGVKVDFYVLGQDEFSREEFKRKRKEAFDEKRLAVFASPEDTIIKKLQWFKMGESQKHLEDIKGMLRISADKLDLNYIKKWSIKLNLFDIWEKVKGEL